MYDIAWRSRKKQPGQQLGDQIRDSHSAFFALANDVFTSTIAIRSMLQMTGSAMNLLRSFVNVSWQSMRREHEAHLGYLLPVGRRAFIGRDN